MPDRAAILPRLMSAADAARYLGIGETFLRELARMTRARRPTPEG